MAIRLDARAADFAEKFRGFLDTKRETPAEGAGGAVVGDVGRRGARALQDSPQNFDHVDLDRIGLKVSREDIAAATAACNRDALAALQLARDRIEAYHRRQLPKDDRFTDALGVELGSRSP